MVNADIPLVSLAISSSVEELQRWKDERLSLERQVEERLKIAPPPRPFFLLTPLGCRVSDRFALALAEGGMVIAAREPISSWSTKATHLYLHGLADWQSLRARAFEILWQRYFPDGHAQRWFFANDADWQSMAHQKTTLRQLFPSLQLRVDLPLFSFWANLHSFHLPDPEDLAWETACLEVTH